jgi:hypothetical protein
VTYSLRGLRPSLHAPYLVDALRHPTPAAWSRERRRELQSGRSFRLAMFTLTVVLLGIFAVLSYATWTVPWWQGYFQNDFIHYMDAVNRWIATGSPYPPAQVAAPFDYTPTTFMHPPIALLLFAPFLVIPATFYWLIPLSIAAWVVVSYRPAPWSWPLMAMPLVLYPAGIAIYTGGSDVWAWAAFAAGLRWGWPAALLALKPSLILGTIIGIRHPSWWKMAAILALVALPFGWLWVDWIHVVLNSRGTLLYSAGNVFMFSIPLIARLAGGKAERSSSP